MSLSLQYGWTFEDISNLTIQQIMLASDTDPKAKGKGGKSSGGKKYAQPIRSAADIAPLLARQQARQLSNATRG